uniref:Uncharacterized protein n=1 Tax=Physcomitrium patens TaxID=3218 RepID=A0A7I3ZZP2_PHYPA
MVLMSLQFSLFFSLFWLFLVLVRGFVFINRNASPAIKLALEYALTSLMFWKLVERKDYSFISCSGWMRIGKLEGAIISMLYRTSDKILERLKLDGLFRGVMQYRPVWNLKVLDTCKTK